MHDPTEVLGHQAGPARASGLTFVGLLAGAVMAAVVIGQLTGPDPSPQRQTQTNLADLQPTPGPDRPISVDSIRRCPAPLGGLALGDHPGAHGSPLERWDCGSLNGPWSVVIRAAGGHFAFHSAVVTFPVLVVSGVPSTRPADGVWNPGAQKLVWPLGGSYAQIVGDLGQATLEDLATRITVEGEEPRFSAPGGFTAAALTTYGSPVVHEMRYGAKELGREVTLGDGLVFTGVATGADIESLAFEAHANSVGLVRGSPAIFTEGVGGNGAMAWEAAPGEVTYIGYSGSALTDGAIEALRALADTGRVLSPAQWETRDRFPVAAPSGKDRGKTR